MAKLQVLIILFLICFTGHAQVQQQWNVYFEFNSYAISKESAVTLNNIVTAVRPLKTYTLNASGYTDSAGTAQYNMQLALNRANAVSNYLETKDITTSIVKGTDIQQATLPDNKQRRVIITLTPASQGVAVSNVPETVTAPGGTTVTPSTNVGTVSVAEFFTARSMIAGGMYCIDEDDNILSTAGMIEICRKDMTVDASGQFYTIMMPATKGYVNTTMSMWLQVVNKEGELRWQNTAIQITTDPANKYYIFKVPMGVQDCLKINLDKLCISRYDCKIIYIATDEPYNFDDVYVGNTKNTLSFSAKVNDTLWAFTGTAALNTRSMDFRGTYNDVKAGKKELKLNLRQARYTTKDGNDYFYICKDCHTKESEGKGFFGWLKNLFKKKK